MTGRLALLPITLADANAFVQQHHRHHPPVVGHKFSLAAAKGGQVVGVAIIGRPVEPAGGFDSLALLAPLVTHRPPPFPPGS